MHLIDLKINIPGAQDQDVDRFMHNLIPFVYINVVSLSQEICIISHLLVAQLKSQYCLIGNNKQETWLQ